jgi:hypothetical protein
MRFMKHHSASTVSLILHQLGWQDQPEQDSRYNKTLLWRSAAKCLLGVTAGSKYPQTLITTKHRSPIANKRDEWPGTKTSARV